MIVTNGRFRSFLFVLGGVFLAGLLNPGWAQVQSSEGSGLGGLTGQNPMEQLRQRLSTGNTLPLPMEGAVDPAEYIVGPGDQFEIYVAGSAPLLVTLPVSADGMLVVPDAGSVRVAGKTLEKAREDVLSAMRAEFSNVSVNVTLAIPRQFYVHVSGAVPVPGRYLATPVARVSSILELVYADTMRTAVTNPALEPSFRTVRVQHRDGSEDSVDLIRYFATGNTDHNPYLNDGDVIHVRSYDPSRESIYVGGAVAFPGAYPYRAGDTVQDLLALADAAEPPLAEGTVRVTGRSTQGGTLTRTFTLQDLRDGAGIPVEARDNVFVVPDPIERGSATVTGWVNYPGTYPIEPGQTTLDELIETAGGFRDGALERGAFLERSVLPDPKLPFDRSRRFDRGLRPFHELGADTTAIMQVTRLAELDFLSRVYLAQELRLQNRVSVDVESVMAGTAEAPPLLDGDRLIVPRDNHTVYVFGLVTRPGYVPYRPGESVEQYIAHVGGPGRFAGEPVVIKAGTGQYLQAGEATVESGDMIFLDRATDIADSPELQRLMLEEDRLHSDARIRTTQTVLQIVTTAATLVTTYIFVRNN